MNEKLKKGAVLVFAAVMIISFIAVTVQADFGCSFENKTVINGTWNATFTNCADEPRANVTIVQNVTQTTVLNITNVTFDQTLLAQQVNTSLFQLNQTIDAKLQVDRENIELNRTLGLCLANLDQTSNFSAIVSDLNLCNENLQDTQSSNRFLLQDLEDYKDNQNILIGAVVILVGTTLYFGRKRIFNVSFERKQLSGREGKTRDTKAFHERHNKEDVEAPEEVQEIRKKIQNEQKKIDIKKAQAELDKIRKESGEE